MGARHRGARWNLKSASHGGRADDAKGEEQMPIAPAPAAPADEHVLDESGHFHATDAPIDLAHYTFEAGLAVGFFWVLAGAVFQPFFTAHVRNHSAAWAEENPT